MENDDIITLPPDLLAHMGWDKGTELIAIIDGDSVILRRDDSVPPRLNQQDFTEYLEEKYQ